LAAVQQYANAVNALNNNTNIPTSDGNNTSSSLYYTLLTQGNTNRTTASDTSRVLSTWHSLKVHCRASASLVTNLIDRQDTLKLERIDVALAAADAKQKLAEVVAASPPAMLSRNLEEFTDQVAGDIKVLAMDTEPTADLIDALQHIVLGYGNVFVTSHTAAIAVGGDNDNSDGILRSWLMEAVPWLPSAAQAAGSISSLAGEMQLIVPHLTLLSASKDATNISDISTAFIAIKEKLENYAELASPSGSSDAFAGKEEEVSVSVMAQLADISTTWPTIGSFMQCLHAVLAATTSHAAVLREAGEASEDEITARAMHTGPVLLKLLSKQSTSSHWECLELAAAAVDTWNDLLTATGRSESLAGNTNSLESNTDAEIDILQKSISSSLSAAVAMSVQFHFLPAVHAVMRKTCADLQEKAKNLPREKPSARTAVKEGTHAMEESFTSITNTTTDKYDDASMLFENGKDDQFQGPAEMLPAFFDYLEDDAGDNNVGLEELDSSALEDEGDEGILELGEQMQQLDVDSGHGGDVGQEESQEHGITDNLTITALPSSTQLNSALSLCSDTSGALAAVDAVLHVTATTMPQAAQQAQQAQVDLAAHQWMYEPILLQSTGINPEDLKIALQQKGFETGGPPSKMALLPSPLEFSLAALLTPRYEVLSNLKSAVSALQSAEEEIQKWKDVAVPIENCFAGELLRIAPATADNIEVCLEAGHSWRNTAVMHGMHLKDALNAVLECEVAKDSNAAAARKVEDKQGNADGGGSDGDRELQLKFEKDKEEYREAVEHVHVMRDALSTAQSSFTTHQNELDTLRTEMKTAAEKIPKIERLTTKAVDQVSNVALPLVKATQKLPATLQTVQEYLENVDVAVEVLSTMHRRLARVHAATASSLSSSSTNRSGRGNGDGSTPQTSLEVQIMKILENLSTSVDFLRTLPSVLLTLQYSVDAARRSLLKHGGRGVAAAREQAGGVVTQCKDAVEKLQPLVSTSV